MREEWRPLVGYEGLYEVSNMGLVKSLERTVWNEKEIWKDIEGFEGLYQVSNMGRVKSLGNGKSNNSKERILKPGKNSNGYLHVILYKDGIKKDYTVHQLVGNAFLSNPQGYKELNHRDEDKTNNNADNLEWCSRSYNLTYNDRAKKAGKKISKPIFGIDRITGFVVEFPSIMEASRQLGIRQGHITECCQGKYKSCGGFYWMYADADTTE